MANGSSKSLRLIKIKHKKSICLKSLEKRTFSTRKRNSKVLRVEKKRTACIVDVFTHLEVSIGLTRHRQADNRGGKSVVGYISDESIFRVSGGCEYPVSSISLFYLSL